MSKNRSARAIIKKFLIPKLKIEGFHGKFPEFQRKEQERLHLLSVVFDKYGGGFFLEVSNYPSGDMETSWGEVVREPDITVAHTPIECRARLQQKEHKHSLSEDWFRFDKFSEDEIEDLVLEVIDLLPQINYWLREKKVGQNISTTEP